MEDPDIFNQEPNKLENDGTKVWDLGGGRQIKLHSDNAKTWWLNGKLHRENGPARIDTLRNAIYWYLNGKLHREDGPAHEWNGNKEWWLNDKLHREDGPAVEFADGKIKYYLNGKKIISRDYNSPEFKKRWQKLLELERVRQVMED